MPASIVPAPPPPLRTATRTSYHERNRLDDELSAFYQLDVLTFESLMEALTKNSFKTFVNDDRLHLQSMSFSEVKVLVCDNNSVNQRYFKMFVTVPNKPWLTENGLFLLSDFVHLQYFFQRFPKAVTWY